MTALDVLDQMVAIRRAGNFEARGFPLQGPLLVSTRRFADHRGVFTETYSQRDFRALGIADDFVQDNQSRSTAMGTVRGLHLQTAPAPQAKLVRVLRGRILDVAVDCRAGSPTRGQHVAVELSAENGLMLYVPVGFAHGFVTREPDTEVAYKMSGFYAPACEAGILWNDPALGIDWGIRAADAVLSAKDARLPTLAALGDIRF
ncbi:dTDP-4-dehydrorhamnose 3,5-epimerase [Falsiroseomonas oryziterrae]|uniref:dTDP-4-dehydrorhamnose 3,5-epimerase n=1 Tax=Falsiroseomonas oryziterrae TaxID=2911368 RepID=UPI001F002F82|nr:dTDP-4-dehydrorhamnose 3,5-epimerase [Roseomonas sp. NPKOSM-4]